jgi:hypothetical protein
MFPPSRKSGSLATALLFLLAVLIVQLCPLTVIVGHRAADGLVGNALAEVPSLPLNASNSADEPPPAIIDRMIATVAGWLNNLVGGDAEALKLYATWIVGAPALVLLALIVMLLRPAFGRKKSCETLKTGIALGLTSQSTKDSDISSLNLDAALTDKQRILKFFFNLFKKQVNADPNSPTELFLVETRATCPTESYEMRILKDGEWATRRMSIGLLGQGGGSRSKCYYVIYDSHLVIKLPVDPIDSFSSYNRQIATEAAIVARLAPRECIVPRVSVILAEFHKIAYSDEMSSDELEKKCIHLLEVKPSLQEHVKIGGSFVFFMDLAKHFFLSTTLEDIHHGHLTVAQEALRNPDLLWDQRGFTGRYGEAAGRMCHVLQDAYFRCAQPLRGAVEEAAIIDDIPDFRLRQWFLIHLAGEQLDPRKEDLPLGLINTVNRILRGVISAHPQEVDDYRKGVNAYIRDIRFSRHRTQLENLASNIIDLLAWLGSHGLALRDLKPENLFVAGDPEQYPHFLNARAKFTIGLIDVETAVVIDAQNPSGIPQPQLAGTPLYATPTHLLSNVRLREIYPDLGTILHMQDWHATVAILYKIVTGENLFAGTAGVFPDILRRLKGMEKSGARMISDVITINSLFWNSAIAEFRDAMQYHTALFTQMEIAVPAAFVSDLIKALHRDSDRIARSVIRMVDEQALFTSPEKRQFLKDAAVEKIRQMKNKVAQEMDSAGAAAHQDQVFGLLEQLEINKDHLQRKLEAAAALKTTATSMAADQLLEAMFEHVYATMYLSHWPVLNPAKWTGRSHLPIDVTTYQATM